jgi:hypothetical protein
MQVPSANSAESAILGQIGDLPSDASTDTTYYRSDNTIRCAEGYVFSDSEYLSGGLHEDVSVLNFDPVAGVQGSWIDKDGSTLVSGFTAPTCVKKKCDTLGIVNSNKEYDVLIDSDTLVGDTGDTGDGIECNHGYVFDTTDTRMGKVKCDVVPIMNSDGFSKENKVAWMVDFPHADELCAPSSSQDECDAVDIPYIISSDTSRIHDDIEPGSSTLKCTWIPDIDDTAGSGFKRDTGGGQCKFIRRVDFNDTEPICRSMYCGNKEVAYSDRVNGALGPLPGPDTGSIHGNCVNFDGQIINNITNSSDCACFQHKSCNTCTHTDNGNNCKWCGYDEDGGGGHCYSSKTYLDICKTSKRNNGEGACLHAKTKQPKNDTFTNKETCENSICVKKNYWDSLNDGGVSGVAMNEDIDISATGQTSCENDNLEWNSTPDARHRPYCYIKSKTPTELSMENFKYYPVVDPDGTIKLNISDHHCVPNNSPFTLTDVKTCNDNLTERTCNGDCVWRANDLSDTNINWSNDKILEFIDRDANDVPTSHCPITNGAHKVTAGTADISSNVFAIDKGANPGYVTILPAVGSTVSHIGLADMVDYFNSCYINNSLLQDNLVSSTQCGFLGGEYTIYTSNYTPPYEQYLSGIDLYNAPIGGDAIGGDAIGGDAIGEYNCRKNNNIVNNGSDISDDYCTGTTYGPDDTLTFNDSRNYTTGSEAIDDVPFKNYLKCNTLAVGGSSQDDSKAEELCNMIGQDNAHWGKMCRVNLGTDSSATDIPLKHVCEAATGATWGNYLSATDPTKFGYGCYNDDGTEYTDDEACALLSSQPEGFGVSGNSLKDSIYIYLTVTLTAPSPVIDNIPAGSIVTHVGSTQADSIGTVFYANSGPYNISDSVKIVVDISAATNVPFVPGQPVNITIGGPPIATGSAVLVPSNLTLGNDPPACIIDRYASPTATGTDDEKTTIYKNICEQVSTHKIGYSFIESVEAAPEAKCYGKDGQPTADTQQASCGTDNKVWKQEYNYINTGTCNSLGSSAVNSLPDITTEWTGGEISNDGGIHRSECSPSIMNSCNVDCDAGYGGGGEYICQYNEKGGDVCSNIDGKSAILDDVEKQQLCESYPACSWASSTCSAKEDKTDGHLEWVGAPCYKIDNTAFSHGIAKLPVLDKVIPPFIRVVIYMAIYLFVSVLLITILVKYGLSIVGLTIDGVMNTSLDGLNKGVDIFTDSDKIFRKLILSTGVKNEHKLAYVILTVATFIGSYYFFQYIKDGVKNSYGKIINKIYSLRASYKSLIPDAVSLKGLPIDGAEQEVQDVQDVSSATGTAIGAAGSDGWASITDAYNTNIDNSNLNMIVQGAGAGIVILIIGMFIARSSLIGKVEQK